MIWWSILFLLVTTTIGFMYVKNASKHTQNCIAFADEFLLKVEEYVQSKGEDILSYEWLITNSSQMQSALGIMGIAEQYKPPFANYMIPNYAIIVNTLPELRQAIERRSRIAYEDYITIRETILRYIGVVNQQKSKFEKNLKNPLIWFFRGMTQILSFPFYILQWAGLLSSDFISRLERSVIYKILSGFVGLVGFIGSIVSIVVEWDSIVLFLRYIQSLLSSG